MVSFLKKMVGDTPERAAEKLRGQLVPQVNRLEDSIRSLTHEALGAKDRRVPTTGGRRRVAGRSAPGGLCGGA